MNETGKKSAGAACLGWWSSNLRPENDTGRARALRARLRRAENVVDILAEPEVHDLVQEVPLFRAKANTLFLLLSTIVLVEKHGPGKRAASVLGSDQEAFKPYRMEKLVRAEGDDLRQALRRAAPYFKSGCNIAALSEDLVRWDDKVRARWLFDYFGAIAPSSTQSSHSGQSSLEKEAL